MASQFDIKIRGPPNEDFVQGFPGISATWPRLEGTVEVRSKDTHTPLQITTVTLALYRTDIVHTPTNKPGISGPKKDQSFLIGDSLKLFQVSAGRTHDELMALDLPFILSLPTNRPLPASICLGKSMVETAYQLFVSVVYGRQQQTHHVGCPIRLKRYDTLSTFGAFRVPIVNSVSSHDHLVGIDYSIPLSAFGPGDRVTAYVKVYPNLDFAGNNRARKKIKIQRLTMQVLEIINFNHDSEEPIDKRRKLCKATNQLDMKLPDKGYQCELSMDFPSQDFRDKDGLVQKERQDIPLMSRNGFTTSAALYSVEYMLVIKARFSHCKDIEIEQPISVTQFDHATCMSFMKAISEDVEYSNKTDHTLMPAPKFYKPSDYSQNMVSNLWNFNSNSNGGGNNTGGNGGVKTSVLVR